MSGVQIPLDPPRLSRMTKTYLKTHSDLVYTYTGCVTCDLKDKCRRLGVNPHILRHIKKQGWCYDHSNLNRGYKPKDWW